MGHPVGSAYSALQKTNAIFLHHLPSCSSLFGYTVSAIAAFIQLVTEGEVRVGDAGEGEELSVLADSLGFIAKIDNVEEMQVPHCLLKNS